MAERQTTNVSLTPHQNEFVRAMVDAGQYRTVSEAVREGLRLLEEAEHRRLLEKWIYDQLSPEEESRLPDKLKERAKAHFRGLVDQAMEDVENGHVVDGPAAMKRLQEQLEDRV